MTLVKSCVCLCVSVRLCLSVIDSTNWYMGCKNKYWYFLSGDLDFGLEKSWDFCGNPEWEGVPIPRNMVFWFGRGPDSFKRNDNSSWKTKCLSLVMRFDLLLLDLSKIHFHAEKLIRHCFFVGTGLLSLEGRMIDATCQQQHWSCQPLDLQCVAVIRRLTVSQILTIYHVYTPELAGYRARYGVSAVSSKFHFISAAVTALLCHMLHRIITALEYRSMFG